MAPPLSPAQFKEEVDRRLIDTFDLMGMAGLRSREGIQGRVRRGELPPPIWSGAKTALWDADAVAEHLAQQG